LNYAPEKIEKQFNSIYELTHQRQVESVLNNQNRNRSTLSTAISD